MSTLVKRRVGIGKVESTPKSGSTPGADRSTLNWPAKASIAVCAVIVPRTGHSKHGEIFTHERFIAEWKDNLAQDPDVRQTMRQQLCMAVAAIIDAFSIRAHWSKQ